MLLVKHLIFCCYFSVEHSLLGAATLLPEVGELRTGFRAEATEQTHSCSSHRQRCARTAQLSSADKHRWSSRPIPHVQRSHAPQDLLQVASHELQVSQQKFATENRENLDRLGN